MKKYILLVMLTLTSALSFADMQKAVNMIIGTAQYALDIPKEFEQVKRSGADLMPKLNCLTKAGKEAKCNEIGCTSVENCIGTSLGTTVKLLDPIFNTLLGTIENNEFTPALIPLIFTLIPTLADSMPDKIKNSSAFAKIKPGLDKMDEWVKVLARFTKTAQNSRALLNGLAFMLAPKAAIEEAPKLEVPAVELSDDTDDFE